MAVAAGATPAPVETPTPTEADKAGTVEGEGEEAMKEGEEAVKEGEGAVKEGEGPVKEGEEEVKEGEEAVKEVKEGAASPTMDKLQQEYKILVQQLDSETPTPTPTPSSTQANGNSSDSATATTATAATAAAATAAAPETPAPSEEEKSEVLRQKNFSFTPSSSISKDYGTPILVREKSYQALPSPDKFGRGIEDHIPFENLPDSVGTFSKMKNLFSILRDKVKKVKK